MAAILPAGDAVYTYTYLVELNKIFYEYEIKNRDKKPKPQNIVKPRTHPEVKNLLYQQKTVLEKNLFLFEDVANYLNTSEEKMDDFNYYISQINNIVNKEEITENDNNNFQNNLGSIIAILKNSSYDNTKVFKFKTVEEEKNESNISIINKLQLKRKEFKKTFKPKLNKFIEEGKKIIFTGLSDEPYFRLPIPAEIPYKESELLNLNINNYNKNNINDYIQKLKEIYEQHKDYIAGYNNKILQLKNKLIQTLDDVDKTSYELNNIKEVKDVSDIKFNFTYNSFFPLVEKGMLYNFIA